MNAIIRDRIEKNLRDHDVVLYIKGDAAFPKCAHSAAAVQFLSQIGVHFLEINVLADPSLMNAILAYSGAADVPLLFVKSSFIGDIEVIRSLHESGQLKTLFAPPPL
jgi:monothiol glutaredoxin